MKHPTEHEWMEYLYGEMRSPQKKALEAHFRNCGACRETGATLRGTQRSLDEWRVEIPARHKFAPAWQPALKWAAAAALLMTTAFATGRMSRPEIDLQALQEEIALPLERRVQDEIELAFASAQENLQVEVVVQLQEARKQALAQTEAKLTRQIEELTVRLAALRQEERKRLEATLAAYEKRRLADYLTFRADLERVALFSDRSFRSLAQLTSYTEPEAYNETETQD